MFGDELFSIDMDRTRELLDLMIARGVGERVRWWCQTHVRFVDYDLFVRMKKAGVLMVGLGIETGDEEKLKTLGKGTNMEMILKARAAAKKAGVPINTYFIIGQPNETLESINKTVELATTLNPDLPIFGVMVPYPGTEVSRLAAMGEAGYRLLSTDWDEYNKQIGGALEFANLSRSQIEWLQIRAYVKVFLNNHRFLDFLKFVWHYRRGAWSVLKKALLKKSAVAQVKYENKLRSASPLSKEDIVSARESWQNWQRFELERTRREAPDFLKVVHVK